MKKIFLDAGHGGKDAGAIGFGLLEKDWVLSLNLAIKHILLTQYEGAEVKLSRETDVFLELSKRAKLANDWGADVFVSSHLNASGGKGHGFETFVYRDASAASKALQNIMHKEAFDTVRAFGNVSDRGKKTAGYAVLRLTNMPAILTETLFIDNESNSKILKQAGFLQAMAESYARGIAKFLGLKGKSAEQPQKVVEAPKTAVKSEVVTKPTKVPTGDNVMKAIQQTLNSRYNTKLAVDGLYGPQTKKALVKGLQTELNKQFNAKLVVDGQYGPATNKAVINVRKGATGNITYLIQASLHALGYSTNGVDGIFGAATESAVKKFQRDKRLASDGIVGKATFSQLF